MEGVRVESGYMLAALSRAVGEASDGMRSDLERLNDAFAAACESWSDINALSCKKHLDAHGDAIRAELERLDGLARALARLSELAVEYENI